MKELTQIFPDSEEGAISALTALSVYVVPATARCTPDPYITGVWRVEFPIPGDDKFSCVVYLAGYPTVAGNVRERNEFESEDMA